MIKCILGGSETKPRIQLRPPYIDVSEYSPAEVECVAQSSTPVTYYWTRLDGELSPDAYISGAWLRFNQVQRSDSGEYQCIARNQYGDDTSVLRVYVRESNPTPPPKPPGHEIVISPSSFTGNSGELLVLTCRNVINVYAPLVWTKHGEAQLPSHVDIKNGVLTIQNARIEDSGRYICTSASANPSQPGESVNEFVDVSINQNGGYLQPPTVKPLNELYTVLQGSDFSLTCEAAGNPYPTITWSRVHEQSLGTNVQQVGNILKIFNAQPHNRGIYQCSVSSNGQSTETSGVIDIEREYF